MSLTGTDFDLAKEKLVFYFQTAILGSGGTFTAANQAEVEAIIDDIADGIDVKLEELKQEIKREIEDDLLLKFRRGD